MRSWLYSFFAGFTLLCISCIDQSDFKIDEVTTTSTWVGKLVKGKLQITDLLNKDDSLHFKTADDGLLYVTYEQELASKDIRELFDIPSKAVSKSFVMPGATIPPHSKDIRSDSIIQPVDFGIAPEKLTEAALNTGKVTYSTALLPSSSNLDYEVQLVLPGFKSRTTGKTLSTTMKGSGTVDLSDYTVALTDNKFDMKLVLVFKKTTKSTVITPASSVNVTLNFGPFKFTYIKGFLGDQTTTLDAQTVPIGVFDGTIFEEAQISIAQPKVNIAIYNENGVPITVHFTKLEARKSGSTPLQISLTPANPVSVAFPTVMGDTKVTNVSVSNVKALVNYAPEEIFYSADARINEGLTSGTNFMVDTSELKVKLSVEVPLWGSAAGVVLQDTLDVQLDNIESSEVSAASLEITLINEFPLDGNAQFILTDANYKPISSLLLPDQTHIIKGSTVNATGDLLAAGQYVGTIVLDPSKIGNLFSARHIIFVTNLQTSRNASGAAQDVKFKASYSLSVDIAVSLTLNLKVE